MSLFRLVVVSVVFLTLILPNIGLASPSLIDLPSSGSDFEHGVTTPICDRLFKSSPSDVVKSLGSPTPLQRQLSVLTNFPWNTGDTVAFINVCKYGIADLGWLQPFTNSFVHGQVVREIICDMLTTSITRLKIISFHRMHFDEMSLYDVKLDGLAFFNVSIGHALVLQKF